MQTDIVALGVLIACQLIIFIVGLAVGKRALVLIDAKIESTVNQMYEKVDEKIQATIDELSEVFGAIFEKPIVKKGMSIIGSQGGKATAHNSLTEKIALDVLNGPKLAGVKLLASGIGMDVDAYVQDHGAVNTIEAIKSLSAHIPGLDLGSMLMSEGPNLAIGHEANGAGDNPYRR